MKKRLWILLLLSVIIQIAMTGCGQGSTSDRQEEPLTGSQGSSDQPAMEENQVADKEILSFSEEIQELEEGLSIIQFAGNYGFDELIARGGASSDSDVVAYLTDEILSDMKSLIFGGNPFGCSTLSVANEEGGYLFGRNFDWNFCNAMVVRSEPESGYASIATVNTDFIQAGGVSLSKLPDNIQAIIGMYAPLDGMNEEGFVISVNMIQDADTIEQDTDKPDVTTTTAVRLLLNQAANVEEAITLLGQYDLHASMGMMVHFAMADADGRSVVVEYIDNEMVITQTPIVTNFYFAEGEKYGIGTSQSHKRYDLLNQNLKNNAAMSETDVRDALDSVSKDNFDGYESTEWSIVMNQETKEMTYYHRENYKTGYSFSVR